MAARFAARPAPRCPGRATMDEQRREAAGAALQGSGSFLLQVPSFPHLLHIVGGRRGVDVVEEQAAHAAVLLAGGDVKVAVAPGLELRVQLRGGGGEGAARAVGGQAAAGRPVRKAGAGSRSREWQAWHLLLNDASPRAGRAGTLGPGGASNWPPRRPAPQPANLGGAPRATQTVRCLRASPWRHTCRTRPSSRRGTLQSRPRAGRRG